MIRDVFPGTRREPAAYTATAGALSGMVGCGCTQVPELPPCEHQRKD